MRLLLTGATGYLGTHIRNRLAMHGADVVTVSRRADAGTDLRIDPAEDSLDHISALLADVAPDVVVNCAGATSGGQAALAAGNVTGVAALVEAMLRTRITARLVHLGSAAEYGRVEPGVPVHEETPTHPVAPYGVSKLAGTRLVQLARTAGLDAVVLRVFNPVGPGAPVTGLPGRLVTEVARAHREHDAIRLGPLDAVRDFVDARDVAEAVHAAARVPVLDRSVVNIGSGRGVPARTLVDTLLRVTGITADIHEDAPGSARSGDVPWQQADISAAEQFLGWRPRTDLETSLLDMWKGDVGAGAA